MSAVEDRILYRHSSDEECIVDPDTHMCIGCRTYHGDPCPCCGGRGFHRPTCSTIQPTREDRLRALVGMVAFIAYGVAAVYGMSCGLTWLIHQLARIALRLAS